MGFVLHAAAVLFALHVGTKALGIETAAQQSLAAARWLFWVSLMTLACPAAFAICDRLVETWNSRKGTRMDWDRISGNWKQIKGSLREQWGKLTDDDVAQLDGSREQLEGKIQERYGYGKDQARQEIDNWSRRLS